MTKRPEMMLWLDDHRGIYIPRDFALSFADRAKAVANVDTEQWAILEAGPDHEHYWDAWQEVCDYALVTDQDGNQFTIWQDGACWLIPVGMEFNEKTETFEWPAEQEAE